MNRVMAQAYDEYFATGYYGDRYPACNPATLSLVLAAARPARRVLDFGCGNGRYVLPLLNETAAEVVAHDISEMALAALRRALSAHPRRERVRPLGGELDDVVAAGPYDLAMMLFGVLSHIQGRAVRLETLSAVRRALAADGPRQLIVTVPNLFRRFQVTRWRCARDPSLRFDGQPLETGDIVYTRQKGGKVITLFYHLYTPARLRRDLEEAGYGDVRLSVESVFPETLVTRKPLVAALDSALRPLIPVGLGYGITAVATARS